MTTYTADQYDENYPPGTERYFWNVARNGIIARALKRSGMHKWPSYRNWLRSRHPC